MEGNESVKKIVLEIVDRSRFWFNQWHDRRKKKFNIARFHAREAAYAFLRQYDGEHFIKAQTITMQYNNQELHLCVRDLVYGKTEQISSTIVEFIYRKAMFSEIRWPVITDNRVIMKTIQTFENKIPEIHFYGDYSSINVDEPANVNLRIVSFDSLEDDQSSSKNSTIENTDSSFCRVQRSVSGLQKLINADDGSLTLDHDTDNGNHFRSSIYIHINQNSIS